MGNFASVFDQFEQQFIIITSSEDHSSSTSTRFPSSSKLHLSFHDLHSKFVLPQFPAPNEFDSSGFGARLQSISSKQNSPPERYSSQTSANNFFFNHLPLLYCIDRNTKDGRICINDVRVFSEFVSNVSLRESQLIQMDFGDFLKAMCLVRMKKDFDESFQEISKILKEEEETEQENEEDDNNIPPDSVASNLIVQCLEMSNNNNNIDKTPTTAVESSSSSSLASPPLGHQQQQQHSAKQTDGSESSNNNMNDATRIFFSSVNDALDFETEKRNQLGLNFSSKRRYRRNMVISWVLSFLEYNAPEEELQNEIKNRITSVFSKEDESRITNEIMSRLAVEKKKEEDSTKHEEHNEEEGEKTKQQPSSASASASNPGASAESQESTKNSSSNNNINSPSFIAQVLFWRWYVHQNYSEKTREHFFGREAIELLFHILNRGTGMNLPSCGTSEEFFMLLSTSCSEMANVMIEMMEGVKKTQDTILHNKKSSDSPSSSAEGGLNREKEKEKQQRKEDEEDDNNKKKPSFLRFVTASELEMFLHEYFTSVFENMKEWDLDDVKLLVE